MQAELVTGLPDSAGTHSGRLQGDGVKHLSSNTFLSVISAILGFVPCPGTTGDAIETASKKGTTEGQGVVPVGTGHQGPGDVSVRVVWDVRPDRTVGPEERITTVAPSLSTRSGSGQTIAAVVADDASGVGGLSDQGMQGTVLTSPAPGNAAGFITPTDGRITGALGQESSTGVKLLAEPVTIPGGPPPGNVGRHLNGPRVLFKTPETEIARQKADPGAEQRFSHALAADRPQDPGECRGLPGELPAAVSGELQDHPAKVRKGVERADFEVHVQARPVTGEKPPLAEPAEARKFSLREPERLAEFLAEKARVSLPKSIEIRLDPPNLGRVTVLLSQRGNDVVVKFLAQSFDAQRALTDASGELARALAEKGLFLSGFLVDLGGRGLRDESAERDRAEKPWSRNGHERRVQGTESGSFAKGAYARRAMFEYTA
ncbi:MAG: flagellar hook-length control protein FliK [Candidatus Fermentithermobacillus carboniphilus]|uniref:Flagellar hook-length control protein FliK n=1 Tax=Candidatus Fermentithermobacillus carboniphilus TaxID=3085328 RepID=A0AAT9LC02_9FIRM|nr:MAG: flagellar hook-length control protein FliK [Candidatus Fermentithermobacillus carboniphilus]